MRMQIHLENDAYSNANYAKQKHKQVSACLITKSQLLSAVGCGLCCWLGSYALATISTANADEVSYIRRAVDLDSKTYKLDSKCSW